MRALVFEIVLMVESSLTGLNLPDYYCLYFICSIIKKTLTTLKMIYDDMTAMRNDSEQLQCMP